MVFSDRAFLFLFLPVAIALIFAASKVRLKFFSILILSALFYFYSAGLVLGALIFTIFVSWASALVLQRLKNALVLAISIIVLLAPLFYFKYAFFIASNVGVDPSSELGAFLSVALPSGISFFTFQAISYVVDVYRGDLEADPDPVRYGAYLSFFPQLIAGPIVRYAQVHEDFMENHESLERFSRGVVRFGHGLLKKLIIADSAGLIVDACYGLPNDDITFMVALLGAVAYTIQIYFDFSGYSDMAIGLGLMFGIRFPENFLSPYSSRSITEFWRRWHVSLSNWFRDYLYISLGGNRGGAARTYLNLFVVFVATGIWHGAAWTFVIWGLYHGAFIIFERAAFGNRARRFESEAWRYFYLLPVVMIGWIIFRATSFDQATTHIMALFSPVSTDAFYLPPAVVAAATPTALLGLMLGCLEFLKPGGKAVGVWLEERLTHTASGWVTVGYAMLALLIAGIASLASGFSPFLYFQF